MVRDRGHHQPPAPLPLITPHTLLPAQRAWYVNEATTKSQWEDPRKALAAGASGTAALTALMLPFLVVVLGGGLYVGYVMVGGWAGAGALMH